MSSFGSTWSDDITASINWLTDPPILQKVRAGTVWHYTTAAGLIGMLRHDVIWASSSHLLNDPGELLHGSALVKQAIEAVVGTARADDTHNLLWLSEKLLTQQETYVVAASTDGDSLSQWRDYAGVAGYAVGFDAAGLLALHREERHAGGHDERASNGYDYVSQWMTVTYDDDEKAAIVQAFIDHLLSLEGATERPTNQARMVRDAYVPSAYWSLVSTMKHSAYRGEVEVRLLARAAENTPARRFRAGTYGVTPYVELTQANGPEAGGRPNYSQSNTMKLPIRQIRIGPHSNAGAARIGLESALVHYGYDQVEVLESDIQVRYV